MHPRYRSRILHERRFATGMQDASLERLGYRSRSENGRGLLRGSKENAIRVFLQMLDLRDGEASKGPPTHPNREAR